jgi:hypothetical protein
VILLDAIKLRPDNSRLMALRNQAQQVMDRLMQNRNASNQYHAHAGHEDPLIVVTGCSAIDRAIDSTREMLQDLESSVNAPQKQTKFNTMCNGLSRVRSRLL